MAYVTTSWGRPIQGVSQQPDRIRLEGQCTKQLNFQPDVVKGLTRRPATRFVSVLGGIIPQNAKHHSYDRGDESYYMRIDPNTSAPKVFDTKGRAMVVNGTAGYLSVAQPADDIHMHTVGDFTFITNRSVNVTMDVATTPAESRKGIIYCQYATYGKEYAIYGDGIQLAYYKTPDGGDASHADAVNTNYVAQRLYTEVVGGHVQGAGGVDAADFPGVPGWSAELHTNCIFLWKTDGSDYKLTTMDSTSGNDLKPIKGSVKAASDLPPKAPEGYIVRITGEGKSTKDDYWVMATNTNDAKVTWRESPQPGIPFKFNAGTMPHVLIRQSVDGSGIATFQLQPAEWGEREVGGIDSNPVPAFIDPDNPMPIKAVGTFQNRLFFLANESWIASRSGLFFNFWRESGQTAIDTDPLDGYADTDQVNFLYNYEILNGDLVLFSDKAQFMIKGDKPVTKSTLTLRQITAYPNNIKANPQAAGENIFFAFDAAGYTGVRELFTDNYVDTKKAYPVTDYVSRYIPGSCIQMLSSPNFNAMFLRSPSDRSSLWAYNWIWQGEQKVQSAWHQWVMDGDVEYVFFMDDLLYLITNNGGASQMSYLYMVNDPDDVLAGFIICLDNQSSLTATYNPNEDYWEFTSPFHSYKTPGCVLTSGDPALIGSEIGLISDYPGHFIIKERVANRGVNVTVQFGTKYRSEYIPTNPVVKDARERVIGLDKIILQGIYIHYEQAGFIGASVTPVNNRKLDYTFHGRYMGSDANLIGTMKIGDGTFRVPVRNRADGLEFVIWSDSPYPLTIRDMECNGTFHQRGQRI